MAQPNQARPACLTCLEPASGIRTFPTLDFGVPDPSLKLGWAEAGNAKRLQLFEGGPGTTFTLKLPIKMGEALQPTNNGDVSLFQG